MSVGWEDGLRIREGYLVIRGWLGQEEFGRFDRRVSISRSFLCHRHRGLYRVLTSVCECMS